MPGVPLPSGPDGTSPRPDPVWNTDFGALALALLDGTAADDEVALLRDNEERWIQAVRRLLNDAETALARVKGTVKGPERSLVIDDFTEERRRLAEQLAELTGESGDGEDGADSTAEADAPEEVDDDPLPAPPDHVQLHLSWARGRVVAWAAGHQLDAEPVEQVRARLGSAGAPMGAWTPSPDVQLPGGKTAPALCAPVLSTLGWLVSLRSAGEDARMGTSVAWVGLAAALAVRLAAQGRMVPQLDKVSDNGGRSTYAVQWVPALVDPEEFGELADAMPGAVAALDQQKDPRAFTQTVVSDLLNAICSDAAARLPTPAAPPKPRSATEVAEAMLANLAGQEFEAPQQRGHEISRGMKTWAKSVLGTATLRLVVTLDPPEDDGGWYVRTQAPNPAGNLEPVDAAMSNASNSRREQIKRELDRLETLFEPLQRGKAQRRGEVILSQEEAWELMTDAGQVLIAAGFDVRVPPLSRRKPSPGLKLTSVGGGESVVGAQQLTAVRWSAVFDDVELTAAEIMELAKESKPLVRTGGRWIELDRADLEAAAQALAERADQTQMTGAAMLRHALGLEGTTLAGGVALAGKGWAADLLQSARDIPEDLPTTLPGFEGELRTYQADAVAWLRFLDAAGLGGCLALDMGLGKTPTVLAHLAQSTAHGPAVAIVPPAVVGNWRNEARKFVPGLKVLVHHGANRAPLKEIRTVARKHDLIITTYGTAVRDIAALEDVDWGHVVLDEAQVIKNPASDTAQQLRRLQAKTRVVLTGTPIENGLGDLWALLDFCNPGLMGDRATFVAQLSKTTHGTSSAEQALRTLGGVLVFRRTKAEPAIAAELPDRIDELDHCHMTSEQIGLYQAVLDRLVVDTAATEDEPVKKKGAVLAAITALKQICNHPSNYLDDDQPLDGRSGKLQRLEEIVSNVFAADERMLIFTHFASWGEKLAKHLSDRFDTPIRCYHGGLSRGARDEIIAEFQRGEGAGALVLSLKAGGTGLNLTAASHVVLYDRWWNPAVEDQARDRAWRIGQTKTVVCHRLVCPGTVDERVEEVVAGKRRIADIALPKSSSVGDLDSDQLQRALGIDADVMLTEEDMDGDDVSAAKDRPAGEAQDEEVLV